MNGSLLSSLAVACVAGALQQMRRNEMAMPFEFAHGLAHARSGHRLEKAGKQALLRRSPRLGKRVSKSAM